WFLFLNNTDILARQVFPQYPNPLVNCPVHAVVCTPPAGLGQFLKPDLAAFASNFQTPKVEQASLHIEREVAHRLAVGVSYIYVHGENLIRARDVNLPPPVNVTYPVYDASGNSFLGTYYDVASFSSWQFSPSVTCAFPPCINPLVRPISQLGAVDRKSTRLNSSHVSISYAVFCLKKKKKCRSHRSRHRSAQTLQLRLAVVACLLAHDHQTVSTTCHSPISPTNHRPLYYILLPFAT